MKKYLFLLLLLPVIFAYGQVKPDARTAKPWTYWWWMGSAVQESDISRQLKQMAGAGFGGVHVIPIYGVKGAEDRFIPFLSSRWLNMLSFTVREAAKLNMGVDVTTGTGWPFGGPNVTEAMAAKKWVLNGKMLQSELTGQKVKRAAPGGEGLVLDPFSAAAMQAYLRRFDTTLAQMRVKPRAVYNDSFEAYGANFTAGFTAIFRERNGYDLNARLRDFLDTTGRPEAVRVRRDYLATLSALLRDGFTRTWAEWARKNGFLTRNQAHGSPGNILDLYALADIPETESFGSSRFGIPYLRVDEDYDTIRFGTPQPLAMKFASSPAHLLGKPLVSAEATTWLANHFKVSLSQVKPQLDELFTAGINHVFYHGTTYSPADAAWPGWLFYASTSYGPSSHLWPYLPLLNAYVLRCQERLQMSRPDNDLLVYFPVDDLWASQRGRANGVHLLEVHHAKNWLMQTAFGRLCDSLAQSGYAFDYVSDSLLRKVSAGRNGGIITPGGNYRALLVPEARFIPQETLRRLNKLRRSGLSIIFRASVKKVRKTGIRCEELPGKGLSFIRKKSAQGTEYFLANLDKRFGSGWVKLAQKGTAWAYNPLQNTQKRLPQKNGRIWLDLQPGESCFITVKKAYQKEVDKGDFIPEANISRPLNGAWHIEALQGRPAINLSATADTPGTWTALADQAGFFWGKMRYRMHFDLPENELKAWQQIDLGDVREVAEIKLNGHNLSTLWCLPFRADVLPGILRRNNNVLEVTVSNLSFNYMRLRDGQPPEWKIFYDTNIVDIGYKPFSAAGKKPMPSGLLGPVKLIGQELR